MITGGIHDTEDIAFQPAVAEELDDARAGLGVFFWRDGTVYRGQFGNDKMHGYGVKAQPDGALEVQRWDEGALQFSKPLVQADYCTLTMDGRDWMFESDECINGLAHGTGIATSLDGEQIIVDGRFVLGRMVEGKRELLRLQEG